MNLNGATAMVTGGSSGIGLAIAKTTDFYATAGLPQNNENPHDVRWALANKRPRGSSPS
ncbi:MAG: hypothetical protein ACRD3C_11270 [Vicinamibacterales bacterium]